MRFSLHLERLYYVAASAVTHTAYSIQFLILFPLSTVISQYGLHLTLKDAGVGVDSTHWSGDCLPFLTGSYYGHKIS